MYLSEMHSGQTPQGLGHDGNPITHTYTARLGDDAGRLMAYAGAGIATNKSFVLRAHGCRLNFDYDPVLPWLRIRGCNQGRISLAFDDRFFVSLYSILLSRSQLSPLPRANYTMSDNMRFQSMKKIKIALVGCGGMGTRHLYALRELAATPFCRVELAALCDINTENGERAAVEVETLMGFRPPVYSAMEEMVRAIPELDAVDVVTDPSFHHDVVCQALNLGLHVMVEKPFGMTIRTCRMMMEAATHNDKLISVAENYRRDPSARLARHMIESGAIGDVYGAVLHSVRAGKQIFITPWRHLKERAGPLLDMGVHFTDLIRYQLGEIREIYADTRLIETSREKAAAENSPYGFYQSRHDGMSETVPATAEDSSSAIFRMESGIPLNWMMQLAGPVSFGRQLIWGSAGAIEGFGNRGSQIQLVEMDGAKVEQVELLKRFPEFTLEPLAEHFFPSRVSVGDKAVDWKLIALEYHELAEAILDGRKLEVDAEEGMRAVAASHALSESSIAGRAVTMEEMVNGDVYAYQQEIDDLLGVRP
jgi:predicted dehydrogenase